MTRLFNDPATFTEDMLAGFLDANSRYVVGVPGGVVRATETPSGKVAVVVGGGSGHYPAFCGVVGHGFADGAVVGNIFTSPSAREAASVARAAHGDAGVLLLTGNYAGDVMNFGLAVATTACRGNRCALPGGHRRHRQRRARGRRQASWHRRRLHRIPLRQCRCRGGRRPRHRRADRRQGQRRDPHSRCGVRRLHHAGRRPASCSPSPPAPWIWAWESTASPACRAIRCPPPPSWPTLLVSGVLAETPAGDVGSDCGDPQRTRPHQVRGTVRGVEDRRCAAGRGRLHRGATRGRRTGHQPRHGRLLADGDVARRRTRAAVDLHQPTRPPTARAGSRLRRRTRRQRRRRRRRAAVAAADAASRARRIHCCRGTFDDRRAHGRGRGRTGPHRRSRRRRRPRPRNGQGHDGAAAGAAAPVAAARRRHRDGADRRRRSVGRKGRRHLRRAVGRGAVRRRPPTRRSRHTRRSRRRRGTTRRTRRAGGTRRGAARRQDHARRARTVRRIRRSRGRATEPTGAQRGWRRSRSHRRPPPRPPTCGPRSAEPDRWPSAASAPPTRALCRWRCAPTSSPN